MDKKELENFRKQSDEVMTGIEKLQKEIKKYKTGAESFEVAAELLQNVVDEQSEVTKKLKEYIFGLYDIDTEKVVLSTIVTWVMMMLCQLLLPRKNR